MPFRVESFNVEVVKKNPVELLHREFLKMTGPALIVVMFVASCGALNGSKEGPVSSGVRVKVGETEALVWGEEGDRGAVLSYKAAYDAASWKSQSQTLAENGVVALAVGETSPYNIRFAIDYL